MTVIILVTNFTRVLYHGYISLEGTFVIKARRSERMHTMLMHTFAHYAEPLFTLCLDSYYRHAYDTPFSPST